MRTCPVTHLTVAVHPAWTKEHKKAGYTKVIQRIGQDILLAAITADRDVTLDTLDNDLLQKVTQEPGYSQEHLYLLWDMTHVINLSSTYKKETASIIYNPGNPFKAIIFYNVDSRARTLTETFAAIVQDTIPVYIQETYTEAVSTIMELKNGTTPSYGEEDPSRARQAAKKREFLAIMGRMSWLGMLDQNIAIPPHDDPYYVFFKAMEQLQQDLQENIRQESRELDFIRKNSEELLREQNIQLNAQQELYKQLKQQLEKEKSALTSRLASQEMELTRISTAIAEKTSTLKHLLEIIRDLDIEPQQKQQMQSACESMIETEMIEKKLNIELTATDSEFLVKLQKKHPNLNQRELRIGLLIKLNYDTREIARSIGISTRGMESIRYRMHKKIGLSRHQSIKSYLNELAMTA